MFLKNPVIIVFSCILLFAAVPRVSGQKLASDDPEELTITDTIQTNAQPGIAASESWSLLNGADRSGYELEVGPQPDPVIYQPTAADLAADAEAVIGAQLALKNNGFDPGDTNGVMTDKTTEAILQFQTENVIPVTGELDEETRAALGVSVQGTKGAGNTARLKPQPQTNQETIQEQPNGC